MLPPNFCAFERKIQQVPDVPLEFVLIFSEILMVSLNYRFLEIQQQFSPLRGGGGGEVPAFPLPTPMA